MQNPMLALVLGFLRGVRTGLAVPTETTKTSITTIDVAKKDKMSRMTNNLNSTEVEWPEFGASFNGSWEIPAGSPYVNIDELVGLSNGTLVLRDGDYGSAALVASRCTVLYGPRHTRRKRVQMWRNLPLHLTAYQACFTGSDSSWELSTVGHYLCGHVLFS